MPGTLNVGDAFPVHWKQYSSLDSIDLDTVTLVGLLAAAAIGSYMVQVSFQNFL